MQCSAVQGQYVWHSVSHQPIRLKTHKRTQCSAVHDNPGAQSKHADSEAAPVILWDFPVVKGSVASSTHTPRQQAHSPSNQSHSNAACYSPAAQCIHRLPSGAECLPAHMRTSHLWHRHVFNPLPGVHRLHSVAPTAALVPEPEPDCTSTLEVKTALASTHGVWKPLRQGAGRVDPGAQSKHAVAPVAFMYLPAITNRKFQSQLFVCQPRSITPFALYAC